MSDPEGEFDAGGVEDVFVLDEDGLGGFGAEVGNGVGVVVFGRSTHGGLEHEIELTWFGEERSVGGVVVGDVGFFGGGFAEEFEFLR